MDDAELGARLGEALRQYSIGVINGAVSPFRKLHKQDSVDVTIYFNGSSITVRPIEQAVEPIICPEPTLSPMVFAVEPPVLEAQPTTEETVVEDKPKRKRKTTI